jgi:hypothetical protein
LATGKKYNSLQPKGNKEKEQRAVKIDAGWPEWDYTDYD